jgi:hypothetical protein
VKVQNTKIPQQIKIVLIVIFAILCSFLLYFLFTTFLLNPWLENNQRELCVLNFYSHKNMSMVPEIFFIGTSQMKEGLDCYIIENDFKIANRSVLCYNLAVNADSPLRRLTELDAIIQAKPKIVVIGTDIRTMYSGEKIEESRLILLANKINLDAPSTELYDKEQLKLLHLNPFERDIANRIYIISYLNYLTINKLAPNSVADYEYRNNFKNPYKYVENASMEEKIARADNYDPINDTVFSKNYGDSLNKLALNLTIQELQKNNITVIIIEMPGDPLARKKISDTTKNNYFSFLNTTGVTYYNFQDRYPGGYFHDLTHMNVQGRTSFSHDLAKIIIQDVEK